MDVTAAQLNPSHIAFEERREDKTTYFSLPVVLFLSFLMLAVIALSYFFLSHQSLRLDESQSLWQSSHSPMGVLTVISHDVHVPLYGLILHFWMTLFGTSVASARALSLIFFLLCIPAIYLLAATVYNKPIGLFAALLLATSPFLNWYGSETRMYTLLALLTILNQYFFIRIAKFKKNPQGDAATLWWMFTGISLLGIYTHYFFWLVLFAEAVYFLACRKDFPQNSFRNFIIAAVILVFALAPWLWFVKSQHTSANSVPDLLKPSSIDLFNTLSQFIFGFQTDHLNTIILSLWPITVLLAFLNIRKKNGLTKESGFFLLAAFIPIIIAFLVSIAVRPVFLSRYLILTTPALYIFLAWFLSSFPAKAAMTIKSLLIVVMLFTLFKQTTGASTPVKENYEEASGYVSAHATERDAIILSAPFTLYPFEYYYKGPTAIYTAPLWNPYQVGPIPPFSQDGLIKEIDDLKTTHDRVWVLLSYDQGYQKDVYNYFETHYARVDFQQFSAGLNLYAYQLKYDR